jgi:hypothetical protein
MLSIYLMQTLGPIVCGVVNKCKLSIEFDRWCMVVGSV